MQTVFLILVGGLTKASIYFLVASGLTLVFGVGKVINFAHGSFYVLAMYIAFTIAVQVFGGSPNSFWIALALTPLCLGILGWAVERSLLRRIYGKEHLIQLLLTFGLVYVFTDLYRLVWGVMPKIVPPAEFLGGSISLMHTVIPQFNLVVIACSLLVFFALSCVISGTRFGRLSRAVASDGEMCEILGINTFSVYTGIFSMGCVLAGIGGALATQLGVVHLGMDAHITILAFILVIVGGVGSVKGAAAAAVIVGLVESFGALFLSEIVLVLIYLVMVIVLLVRPYGLFGRPVF
jgi:branched-subunit amino acid ABC-type transport system permease component